MIFAAVTDESKTKRRGSQREILDEEAAAPRENGESSAAAAARRRRNAHACDFGRRPLVGGKNSGKIRHRRRQVRMMEWRKKKGERARGGLGIGMNCIILDWQ